MRCVVVYGREPIAGRAKTRLAASIGDEAAADLYRVLLARSIHEAVSAGFHVVLALSGKPAVAWQPPSGVALEIQRGVDLGERLRNTFDRRFSEGWSRVIVVGSDCPAMTASHIRSAATALERSDVVVGPAEDGGYWLIGQRTPGTDLFTDVPWSSRRTMEATRRRLLEGGVSWTEVEQLSDVDTIEDLRRALANERLGDELRADLSAVISGVEGYHGPRE
jgi:rSAM/selenodomain-associated transferase 1